MAAVENLRNIINERLTAATEEILGVFAQTLSAYEEEICRQRRLLDVVLRPELKLHRADPPELPQHHVCQQEEEDVTDQQLCVQERSTSLNQEEPEPPQIKEEQEQLCTSQEGEQLDLKQETDTLMFTATHEESDQKEGWTDQSQMAAEKELPDNISRKRTKSESDRESSGVPEQNSGFQFVFHTSRVADNQDHTWSNHVNVTNPNPKHKWTKSSDKPFKCNSCGKDFYLFTHLKIHMTTHSSDKAFSCTVCGKEFSFKRNLKRHMTTHSDEKPYACNQCQRTFRRYEHLQVHIRSHTGERPYRCVYCEKALSTSSALTKHLRLHTAGKP